MSEVLITDESFRDGPQSVWKSRMRTLEMTGIATKVDSVGYHKVNLISAANFESAVHYLCEDPWERIRRLQALLVKTPTSLLVRGRNLFGWRRYSDDVVDRFISVLKVLGFEWMMVFDALNDMTMIERHIQTARQLNLKTIGMIAYSRSPVHTFEYYRQRAEELASFGVDAIQMADASGLLMPEEAKQFVRAGRAGLGGKPIQLEFAGHDSTGQALACYETVIKDGIDVISTVAGPLAYGESLPAILDVHDIARHEGRNANLNLANLEAVDDYFAWVAHEQGQPLQRHVTYNKDDYERYAKHQIPGGMMSHLVGQLSDLGLAERLPEVLEEAGLVRAELGYPVMVTPFSQLVAVQALMNILEKERYRTVPQELRLYVQGYYGKSPGNLDAEMQDRVAGEQPRLDPTEIFGKAMLSAFIKENGPFSSDEDMLTALFLSRSMFEAYEMRKMQAIGNEVPTPVQALAQELCKSGAIQEVQFLWQ